MQKFLVLLSLYFIGFSGQTQDMINLKLLLSSKDKDFSSVKVNINVCLEGQNGQKIYCETLSANTELDESLVVLVGSGTVQSGFPANNVQQAFGKHVVSKVQCELVRSDKPEIKRNVQFKIGRMPKTLVSGQTELSPDALDLLDVSGNPQNGMLLKYQSGTNLWVVAEDEVTDSNFYALNSRRSHFADSSGVTLVSVRLNSDSAQFAATIDSVLFTLNSTKSIHTNRSGKSYQTQSADTVLWAVPYAPVNVSAIEIGTLDSSDLIFLVGSSVSLKQGANGSFYKGASKGLFSLDSIDQFIYSASTASTDTMVHGNENHFFFSPKTAGLSINGRVNGMTEYDNGTHYLLAGSRNKANSYSLAVGDSNSATGINANCFGYKNSSTNLLTGKDGGSIVAGYSSRSFIQRSVCMGVSCEVDSGSTAVAMGFFCNAYGSTAQSFGYYSVANGHQSAAFGSYAHTNHKAGSIVFADHSSTNYMRAPGDHTFTGRFAGGYRFYTNSGATSGVTLASGTGSWSSLSDENAKENLGLLALNDAKSLALPEVFEWEYKTQENTLHMGPTAQEFYRKFQLGESKRHVSMVDIDGAVLWEIKKLNKRLEEYNTDYIQQLKVAIASELQAIEELNKRIEALNHGN